jgi:hypothetical protein
LGGKVPKLMRPARARFLNVDLTRTVLRSLHACRIAIEPAFEVIEHGCHHGRFIRARRR